MTFKVVFNSITFLPCCVNYFLMWYNAFYYLHFFSGIWDVLLAVWKWWRYQKYNALWPTRSPDIVTQLLTIPVFSMSKCGLRQWIGRFQDSKLLQCAKWNHHLHHRIHLLAFLLAVFQCPYYVQNHVGPPSLSPWLWHLNGQDCQQQYLSVHSLSVIFAGKWQMNWQKSSSVIGNCRLISVNSIHIN